MTSTGIFFARPAMLSPVDKMTSKHLDRMRIRGVSATEPEATGLREGFGLAQVRRQAVRALAMKLGNPFSVSELQATNNKLAQLAAVQQLRVLGQPLLALDVGGYVKQGFADFAQVGIVGNRGRGLFLRPKIQLSCQLFQPQREQCLG